MRPSDEAIFGLYELLARFDFPRPSINYRARHGRSNVSLAVAWPDLKMGFSFTGDETGPLEKAGWFIAPLEVGQLNAIAPLLAAMSQMRFQVMLHRSAGAAKRTISKDEQALLRALLEAGLPMPERNLTVKAADGSMSVTPDFAWDVVDGRLVKVVLELDGWFHHGGRDLDTELKEIAATDPARKRQLMAFRKDQQAKDAAKRRLLAERGWQVVSVLDTELADGKTAEVVATVAAVIAARQQDDLTEFPDEPAAGAPAHGDRHVTEHESAPARETVWEPDATDLADYAR